jgi:DNA polymerase I
MRIPTRAAAWGLRFIFNHKDFDLGDSLVNIIAPVPNPALDGVRGVYCDGETKAEQLLGAMLATTPRVAIDIETAANWDVVNQLTRLERKEAEIAESLKAARKLKDAKTITALTAERKLIKSKIKYARTAGLDPCRSHIRLLQVYAGSDVCLVIDLDRAGLSILRLLDGIAVVAHNAGFELAFIERHGHIKFGKVDCTLQATRLRLGEWDTSLETAAKEFFGLDLDKTLQVSDWNAARLTQAQVQYAAIDAVLAWRIAEEILPQFDRQRPAYAIQVGVVPAAARMQARGFKLDRKAHADLIGELEEERTAAFGAYRQACFDSGHADLAKEIPSSAAKKGALLTALLTSAELKTWKRTEKSGALSTRRSDLMRAASYAPISALVKLSRLDKRLSAFGEGLATLVSPVTKRVHAHYRVAGTASGRASCAAPNIQQIPKDPRFRRLFIPEPGYVLIIADYSSMELRAAAHISHDAMLEAVFERGDDLHRLTAARMTGKPPKEISDEERKGAKVCNFGSVYGMGAAGLVLSAWQQFDLVLDLAEATTWLKSFNESYKAFARWRRQHYDLCEARGYIVIGRDMARGVGRFYPKSRVPPKASFYTRTCNLPIQGACADASMLALTYVDARLADAGIEGGPVCWMHDEIVLEVRAEDAERAAAILKQAMIDGFAETFPGATLNGLVKPEIASTWAGEK